MARVKVWLDGEILTASDLNAEFDNALASSLTPDTLDDVSGNLVEMQAVADPYPAGAASLATTMRGEIQRLRYLLKQITGKSEWYIDPDITLAAIATIGEQTVFGRITGGVATALSQAQLGSVVFATGTKMWFYQDTAPLGWTIDATPADAVLAVKGGTQAYNTTGGSQAGTWTQPDHIHSYSFTTGGPSATIEARFPDGTSSVTVATQGHTHSKSGNTAATATPASYRPLANVGIIASKD